MAAALVTHAAPVQAADYVIDTVHTQIRACVSHLGFTRPCARLRVKHGTFHFDADHWDQARVDAFIDATSLELGDAAWNAKLRSWEFLETDKYPDAHFVSRAVEKTGDHSAIVHGTLTLRGVARLLDLNVTFNRAGLDPYNFRFTAGFSATATFKRSDFGMKKYLPDVGDDVTIRIEVEGLRGEPSSVETAPRQAEH